MDGDDRLDAWLEAEAARRLAADSGERTSFEGVMAELGLTLEEIEAIDAEVE